MTRWHCGYVSKSGGPPKVTHLDWHYITTKAVIYLEFQIWHIPRSLCKLSEMNWATMDHSYMLYYIAWRQEHGGQGKLKKARVVRQHFHHFVSSSPQISSICMILSAGNAGKWIEDTLPGHGRWGGLLSPWPRFLLSLGSVTWTRIHLDTWIPPLTLSWQKSSSFQSDKLSRWAGRTFNCSPILKDQILGSSLSLTFCDFGWTS